MPFRRTQSRSTNRPRSCCRAWGAALVLLALSASCQEAPAASETTNRTHSSGDTPEDKLHRSPTERVRSPRSSAGPVFGAQDSKLRKLLQSAPVVDRTPLGGGRSVAFKLTLEGGRAGVFKPEQSFAANWNSELASYYLDRLLGLGRVPPVIGRRFAWAPLRDAARKHPHVSEVVVRTGGTVRGSFMAWLSEELVPVSLPKGWEALLSIEPPFVVSPFQRKRDYEQALRAHGQRNSRAKAAAPISPAERRALEGRIAEISDLVVFDYLIANHDRWGGGFTNVRTLGKDGPLIYIDNANGFPRAGTVGPQLEAKLDAVQRFRSRTVTALKTLRIEDLTAALESDPLSPLLSEEQLKQLEQRLKRVLTHIKTMQAKFGAKATPW